MNFAKPRTIFTKSQKTAIQAVLFSIYQNMGWLYYHIHYLPVPEVRDSIYSVGDFENCFLKHLVK